MMTSIKIVSITIASFLFYSCDKTKSKIQYMPDMADSPITKAQRSFVEPPMYSVPMNKALYPKTAEEAETLINNPYTCSDEEIKKEGEKIFGTYCMVCHSQDAKGQGSIGESFPLARPDLTAEKYQTRKDGFFFHRISFGVGMMPAYGDKTSIPERWKIICHLRQLQGKGN